MTQDDQQSEQQHPQSDQASVTPARSRAAASGKARIPSRTRAGQLSGVQIMFAAILAIGIALGISLSSRIASSQPLRELYDQVDAELEALRREQGDLIAERNYAENDAYVEQWARTDGKMVRPGEVLVVVVPGSPPEASPQPTPQVFADVNTTPPEPDSWTLWWHLFFDGPPPNF